MSTLVPAKKTAKALYWKKLTTLLTSTQQDVCPNNVEKIKLASKRMANVELTFEIDGDVNHIHKIIMNTFPALQDCGDYSLLVASGCSLIMIKPPESGYTVKYLRDTIHRGVLYLQKNIYDNSAEPSSKMVSLFS